MADILVADDTKSIRGALTILLEEAGHAVRVASDGEEALREYARRRPDMILLDVMMPKKNGYQVLKQIRRDDPGLPVIFLSAKGSPADVSLGLDLGSDDYLPKPFDGEVLISRINAVFRRVNAAAPSPAAGSRDFSVGSYRVDVRRHTLVDAKGREQALSVREMDILRMFSSAPGEVITRDEMLNRLWGVNYAGTTRTLDQHIAVIRKKLGRDGARIESVRGAGYRYA